MSRTRATLAAALVVVLAYVAIAWVASGVPIPSGAPSATSPWVRPFRVVAEIGFVLASTLHLPHLAGQLIAAVLLGAVLGALFATVRSLAQR